MKLILLYTLSAIITIAIVLALSYGLFNLVMNSNLPDWLKYIILK